MKEILNIRVSPEEKQKLQQQAQAKGFKNNSDFVRFLMGKGLEAIELSKPDYYLLANTNQSVLLLREILSIISTNPDDSNRVVDEVKKDAANWVDKFSKKMGSNEF